MYKYSQFFLSFLIFFTLNCSVYCQSTTFLDFEGDDFQFSTTGLVATSDSLYVLTKGDGVDTVGILIGLNKEGTAYDLIKAFNGAVHTPNNLIGNDVALYGCTRFSENGGGAIFKYTFTTGQFEIIKDFSPTEAQEIEIVHLTDSVLWGLSSTSFEDEGSIFTIELDGSNFNKIYNNTTFNLGQNPVDIEIVDEHIYIACFNGGGIPYDDGVGGTVSSGSIIRINTDGSGYTNIFQGQDMIGTQPRSLVRKGDFIYGLFGGRGSNPTGSISRFNIDGTNFEILGNLEDVGRSDLFLFGDYIFGITTANLFTYGILTDQLSNDFAFNDLSAFDGVAGPVFFNNNFIVATQQGGIEGGGILANHNFIPEVVNPVLDILRNEGFNELNIDFANVFVDKDMDELTYSSTSSMIEVVEVNVSGNSLIISELSTGTSNITLTAEDQDGGVSSQTFSIRVNAIPKRINSTNLELDMGTELKADLDTIFQDSDIEDDLIFKVSSIDESIMTVSINSNILSISGQSTGSTELEVEVNDGNGGIITENITVIVNELILAIENFDLSGIQTYPNPASSTLSIDLGNMLKNVVDVRIIDLRGAEQISSSVKNGENELILNLSKLKVGTYVVIINAKNGSLARKFFKE